jgi:hypothetical protein
MKPMTFQIQIHEGSNQIEIHYKTIEPKLTTTTMSAVSVGIEDGAGESGLQYLHGTNVKPSDIIPPTPFAVRFERPIKIDVESKYLKPDGVTASNAGYGLSPAIGVKNVPYKSLQRFEAPEFIYLNDAFMELPGPGDPNDSDPAKIARYRLRNVGYAIDGETVQGVERFFERTITDDMKVIWRWELQYAVTVGYFTPDGEPVAGGNGFGDPGPKVGRSWYVKNASLAPEVNCAAGDSNLGYRYALKGYQIDVGGTSGKEVPVDETVERFKIREFNIIDWVQVRWIWVGQVRYRISALGSDATLGNPPQIDQAFILRGDSLTPAKGDYCDAPSKDFWLDTDSPVRVGAFYRTADRSLTLNDFTSPPSGDLIDTGLNVSKLLDEGIVDTNGKRRVARVSRQVTAANPSEMHFVYKPTVFRAIIPFGGSLSALKPDVTPSLPNDAVLRSGDRGPVETAPDRIGAEDPGGTPFGNALRWDQLGKALFPVHPGTYRLDWPHANDPAKSYKIEVVSGYPGDPASLVSALEKKEPDADPSAYPNGMREKEDGKDVFIVPLDPVDEGFPAEPRAHYRHLRASTPDRNPPTRLDLSTTDAWKFHQLTFKDRTIEATANTASPGVPFTVQGNGRCVLLFSYRPNPDEVADGSLADEQLAVRVVESKLLTPLQADDPKFVLGRRGLAFGSSSAADTAYGLIRRGTPASAAIDPGKNFVIDFWLNAKGLAHDAPPLTVLTTKGGKLAVTLDPASAMLNTVYRGLPVVHPYSRSGSSWRHIMIHAFEVQWFGVGLTFLDVYLDGVRQEQGRMTAFLDPAPAISDISETVNAGSLRFAVGADPQSRVLFDQFRMFGLEDGDAQWLTPGEIQTLRASRDMKTDPENHLRAHAPRLWFSFEGPPSGGSFDNLGTLQNLGIGPVADDPTGMYAASWAHLDIQEVATRLESTLDNAGFGGSGYILNAVSNYNADLYNRAAEVGEWGPVFPVNDGRLFTQPNRRLEVAYYENPHLADPRGQSLLHPNVAWPYAAAAFNEVTYPRFGPHAAKAIYIASRIGSEGVDRNGSAQEVYDLARYSDLKIYNQPSADQPGYNPNEEHALTAESGRAALKVKNLGESLANNPPMAAFALQNGINTSGPTYTSDPWVLVQVKNLLTGEQEMAAYQVFKTRDGLIAFPRPSAADIGSISGLTYESAENPEDAFLTLDPKRSFDFNYQFEYPAYAGDLLIPPYPLNLVIGNSTMTDARGNSMQRADGVNQRTLWRDVNHNAWVVSGGGSFFHQFFYPFRPDFHLPGITAGTPVAWLPDDGKSFTGVGLNLSPLKVVYQTHWRSDYPKLKRGETLTYQGGEYFNQNPGSNGLPSLVAMAATEIVYDSATPSMVIGGEVSNSYQVKQASARIIRPLDRRETAFTVRQMAEAQFTPAKAEDIFVVAERWYFKALPGSLQKRFYFDSLAERLVFRGRLNDKESGDSDLTSGPDPINFVEPNVMTQDEYTRLRNLSPGNPGWAAAINKIYLAAQNPHGAAGGNTVASQPVKNLQGIKNIPAGHPAELSDFWKKDGASGFIKTASPVPTHVHLDSFGVGSALVPNPDLLTRDPEESLFVTIAENNSTELDGAPVSLHIIEIIPDRFRGAIQVIEGADAFSENITLQHNGDFGANTDDLYYEWWIRDAASLDLVAEEVKGKDNLPASWGEFIPKNRISLPDETKHLGLHSIVLEGRPDVFLADKLVLARYRHKTDADWKVVLFDATDPTVDWKPGSPAPFQWAGAANSPQLNADGSKRYIPQLVMGWVKRVLDRINPYEARYSDFFNNESPATYSSQIQIAGAPFAGAVALNPDKSVIERTGLIELYETVLKRAMDLAAENRTNSNTSSGIDQALLLAATRLTVLYELLAREAYSDAQDSTINAGEDGGLAGVASFTHAFQNMEADLMHEDLALLRGTDFKKSYPVDNRLFWNYAKGLGEAAYNVNYNISDVTLDGFINEDDARKLYPQGHGDAWGHFLSALGKPYLLLQTGTFSWKARPELYALMQNVLEVDFLDEKTFSRVAAAKARAGRNIVRETYRLAYTQDPDGQWQGYTDGADPARAWGVSEWAHRVGQGAYFDWAVANAIVPEAAEAGNPENLDRIERLGALDEIAEIAGALHEIQTTMDEADSGSNPLGFDSDALAFDLDPAALAGSETHFEQIYNRAVEAAANAQATLDAATQSQNKLRAIGNDAESLMLEALRQDIDYRNRLIEIFGQPYSGQIGFGKPYPEGYKGPDTLLFAYLDKIKIDEIVPANNDKNPDTVTFTTLYNASKGVADYTSMEYIYFRGLFESDATGYQRISEAFKTLVGDNFYHFEQSGTSPLTLPYNTASKYGFVAPDDGSWGQRSSYGKLQIALGDMLAAEIALDSAISDYISFLQDAEQKLRNLQSELELFMAKDGIDWSIAGIRVAANSILALMETYKIATEATAGTAEIVANTTAASMPLVLGLANDATSVARGMSIALALAARKTITTTDRVNDLVKLWTAFVRDEAIVNLQLQKGYIDEISKVQGLVADLESHFGADQGKRNAIGAAIQDLETKKQAYLTAQSEGFRLLKEREAYNKILAAKTQKNRYQDMIFRLSRNEAMAKHESAFNAAARYAWLAARAYDYETSLEPGHPAASGALLDKIVKERQLGLWTDGQPQVGHGGLAEILAQLKGNFAVLKGQLGINNPQAETEKISLRRELFRIKTEGADLAASDARWKDALMARIVPDLNQLPEFVRHCRPFATGVQPGIVIRFPTSIEPGLNCFGLPLAAGDHNYSTANFATKIQSFGVWLDNYNAAGLSTSPRAYLVPVGIDALRSSTATWPVVRQWSVVEQRIPTPFIINAGNIASPNYIPNLDGVEGFFGELRRHGDFRIYHDAGGTVDDSETITNSRLVSRSVWNSEWLLIIPGAGLHVDPQAGLQQFADTVSDIKLYFQTYSHHGQ